MPETLEALWNELAILHPLPAEVISTVEADGQPDAVVELLTLEESSSQEAPAEGSRVLARRYLAPATRLWEGLGGSEAVHTNDLPILALDDIEPPLRALPVGGLYPGDEGYPLIESTVIRLRSLSETTPPDSVVTWLEGLPAPATDPALVWIAAVGDTMPGRGVDTLLRRRNGPALVFGDVLPVMLRADLLMGNLEGSITTGGTRQRKSYTFRFDPAILPGLRNAGFDYLSLTNNHSFDFGEQGFLDTLEHLRNAGIATSGAGLNLDEASLPWETQIRDQKIRVLSIGAYPKERNGFDGELKTSAGESRPGVLWIGSEAYAAMEKGFGPESFNVVMVHGGVEWSSGPTEEQAQLYRSFIDSGADAVIGSHSHVLQGLESYRGGVIAYSLGNFVFPGMQETEFGEESAVLELGFWRGRIRYVRLTPVRIDGRHLAVDESGEISDRVGRLSRALHGE